MNKLQIFKTIKIALLTVAFLLVFEIVFAIPGVIESISTWIQNIDSEALVWLAIWLIMFIQVCVIPIPAIVVINSALALKIVDTDLGIIGMLKTTDCWIFFGVVMSAYIVGVTVAYVIGLKLGGKAVKYIAGNNEDYQKWTKLLDKRGKWFYALTVLLPVFPDDILCIVVGALKFNFIFFIISNLICRAIGLITTIISLAFTQNLGGNTIPWSLIIWAVCFLLLVVLYFIFRKKTNNSNI